jgi:dATP pyrophosphohydrolase
VVAQGAAIVARAPFNVLVFLYRVVGDDEFEYAVLRRTDAGFWQGVTGGGEDDETPLDAARREAFEETGIAPDSPFLKLDTVEPVRVTEFNVGDLWGDEVYVIPQYCFGVLAKERQLTLSPEHTEYRWLRYDEADRLLKYDGNKTALWELDRKVRGLGPRDH